MIPLPNEETTPPVTKMYFVFILFYFASALPPGYAKKFALFTLSLNFAGKINTFCINSHKFAYYLIVKFLTNLHFANFTTTFAFILLTLWFKNLSFRYKSSKTTKNYLQKMMTRCLPMLSGMLSTGVKYGTFGSLRCLPRVLEMPVIPPKQASLTLLLSIPYCVGRHLHDP